MPRGVSSAQSVFDAADAAAIDAALGRRSRKVINYAADNYNEEPEPEPPPKRAKRGGAARGKGAAERGSKAPAPARRRRDASDDDSEASDNSDVDSDGSYCKPRRQVQGRSAAKGKMPRRSGRDGAGGAARYTVSSGEDEQSEPSEDDFESDDGGRQREAVVRKPAESEVERLLAERVAAAEEGEAAQPGAQPRYEYIAKLRGRSYVHCRWVSEEFVLSEHQGAARLKRWHKVRTSSWRALRT